MSRCIPCEAKAELNRQKIVFLHKTALARAISEKQDYAIFLDDDKDLRLCPFAVAIERGEDIVRIVSRFEKPTA
jgi:hypothetical protein